MKQIKNNHDKASKEAMRKLIKSSAICIVFMIVELIGGLLSGSLAILSDAAHMLSDFSGFAVSMFSIIISHKKANSEYSYGYHRAQIVGALSSVVIIWFLTIWLIVEAYDRCISKHTEIQGLLMFVVAVIGLLCNIYMMQILHEVLFIIFIYFNYKINRMVMAIVMGGYLAVVMDQVLLILVLTYMI